MNDGKERRAVGSYEILAALGSGGMGEVYRARDHRLGRDVALKFLSKSRSHDSSAIDRFLREARAASALNHPNIITIHEVGETEAGHYIVMELVQGRTVREVIAEQPPISVAIRVALQVAQALTVAHAAGIVHRDIKPENIMLRDDAYVKVLDFGLARSLGDRGDSSVSPTRSVTEIGTVLGTLRYMSPEQTQGEPLTTASDMFSLGIVLYELATGHHPFQAPSEVGITVAIVSRTPVAPSWHNPELPSALDALIVDMLQKDPRLRPSAASVAAQLEALLFGQSTGAVSLAPVVAAGRALVAREREHANLAASFDIARVERGLVHAVAGEAGFGKTALVDHFLNGLAATRRCRIGRGRCSERLAGTEAYLPFLEALDGLLNSDPGGEVAGMLRVVAPAWFVQLRPPTLDHSSAMKLATETRAGSSEQMKRQLAALFIELSKSRPLVLFLDDVHWADISTVELIAYLADRFDTLRMLLIVAYRPSDLLLARHLLVDVKRTLQGRAAWRETNVGPFSREDVERYLSAAYPSNRFPSDFARLLHERTEGTPLFVTDLVRQLADRGIILEQSGEWQLARSGNLELEMPSSVSSIIQRTIERLDDIDRRLLVAASVQGVEFDSAVVAAAVEMDSEEVEERLERLDHVHSVIRLVDERELARRTPSLRYAFTHILYQNALHATLRAMRRAALSRSVAHAMQQCYGDATTIALQLAVLFETAREFSQAATHFLLASQNASRLFANKEVVVLVHRALELIGELPETPDRTRLELQLQITLGVSLTALHGYAASEVERVYSRARELCGQLGDTPTLVPVLHGLYRFYIVRGRLNTAYDIVRQLIAVAETSGDRDQIFIARSAMGAPLVHLGRFEEAIASLTEGVAQYDRAPSVRATPARIENRGLLYGTDPHVAARVWLALANWLVGRPEEALETSGMAIEMAEREKQPFALAYVHSLTAWLHQYVGDAALAREHAEIAITIAREHDFVQWLALGLMFRGWALVVLGEVEKGMAGLTTAIDRFRQTGAELNLPHFLSLMADAHLRAGHAAEGLAAIDEALSIAATNDDRCWEPELHRLRGELLLRQSKESGGSATTAVQAEAAFGQAIVVAQRQESLSLELRATVSLARLMAAEGRLETVRERLADLIQRFPDTSRVPEVDAARELVSAEGPSDGPVRSNP